MLLTYIAAARLLAFRTRTAGAGYLRGYAEFHIIHT